MLRIKDRNIALIGMDGCGKCEIGNALAEKLGYRFFDDINEDEMMMLNQQKIVFVPADVVDIPITHIYCLKKVALVVFIDVPFSVLESHRNMLVVEGIETYTVDELHTLYAYRRSIYEFYAHMVIISQQNKLDIEKAVDVIIKKYNEVQEKIKWD